MNDETGNTTDHSRMVAAVDLGSNSFHMIIASLEANGSLKIIDRIKEMVRLGAGLDSKNHLHEDTQQRALECLGRFSERLQNIHPRDIRIAATNTLRIAKNARQFSKRARKVLNHRIDIITGIEEARLVYHGAIYGLADLGKKRLVIDIGGGSTELIIGENMSPKKLESIHVGCVSITKKFFPDGIINKKRIKEADIFVRQKIASIRLDYLKTGWEQSVGTSGSIRSLSKVLLMNGITDGTITDKGLKQLLSDAVSFKNIKKLEFEGLSSDRQPVFIGGLIVLNAAFKALKIKQMNASDGALREGLMLDMVGRIQHHDVRESTVEHLASRYDIRNQHAENVCKTCAYLYEAAKKKWSLKDENLRQLLLWAARLHEMGLAISHSGFHRHGAYLALNSDMPGFSIQEQQVLSLLIRFQRQKILLEEFSNFSPRYRRKLFRLMMILRLAVLLNRSMPEYQEPDYQVFVKKHSLRLQVPEHWYEESPLTIADLKSEKNYLKAIDFKLKIKRQ